MNIAVLSLPIVAAAALGGCGTPSSGVAGGAVLGAASGAAIGSMSANAGKGALIGAGIGALGGALYEQEQRDRARRSDGSYYPYSGGREASYGSQPYWDD